MAGTFSCAGDGSTWTGDRVGAAVETVVATDWGALLGAGAAQALKRKANITNRINLIFIVFSFYPRFASQRRSSMDESSLDKCSSRRPPDAGAESGWSKTNWRVSSMR